MSTVSTASLDIQATVLLKFFFDSFMFFSVVSGVNSKVKKKDCRHILGVLAYMNTWDLRFLYIIIREQYYMGTKYFGDAWEILGRCPKITIISYWELRCLRDAQEMLLR